MLIQLDAAICYGGWKSRAGDALSEWPRGTFPPDHSTPPLSILAEYWLEKRLEQFRSFHR
jgi:hypothetical protein